MGCSSRRYSYSRLEKEDPEELKHRKAQFLIYKTLEAADHSPRQRRRSCFSGPRICRIKMGRRLVRLRKRVQVSVAGARVCLYRHVVRHLKLLRHVGCAKEAEVAAAAVVSVPQLLR